ncbi:uncharacterized protein TM35_000043940 [Trypanosoma theileri]|uniref:Uncharacterized protein n=1 Tax=Trypanosoma theileri TaxID=67003 RepID=A0A1X0P6X0_9TRYP|nr:uncharacterized protein TM35_000043940 [Trypanosoma theileri]ORC92180.1 hypothetical protein TM35_000043940 [Trypanosoma theileri]
MISLRSKSPQTVQKDPATIPWESIPSDRVDKSFWVALMEYMEPLQQSEFPLASKEFFSLRNSARDERETSQSLTKSVVNAANELRCYYDEVSLWNPLALAVRLGFRVSVVIQQLLLAKEYNLINMLFVVCCHSCGCDMLRVNSVSEICFRATYHRTNIIRCPMCTECTEVTELPQVGVFFQPRYPSPLLRRIYHRLCWSEEAIKRRLESYFCPPEASFSFQVQLPQGSYLLIVSGLGLVLHLHVGMGAEYLERGKPYQVVSVILEKYLKNNKSNDGKRKSEASNDNNNNDDDDDGGKTEKCDDSNIYVEHGKLKLQIFNGTSYGSYLDLCIDFDHRLEFMTVKPLLLATVPLLLQHLPRGLRSSLFNYFIPRPPGTITTGVYVVHSFNLSAEEFEEPDMAGIDSVLAVIREVHRYSLEDHHGMLLSVGNGGSMFESLFYSFTAALASSLCLAQRVTTRLGEDVAATLSCAIVKGGMKMSSFQGQYDDDENLRSSYPDIQITGPVIYASAHPPIVILNNTNNNKGIYEKEQVRGAYEEEGVQRENSYYVRFELRSTSENCMGTCIDPHSADDMLSYFLSFLEEHLSGLKIVHEPQALVVVVPLATLSAKLMLSTLIDPVMYTRELTGPFG